MHKGEAAEDEGQNKQEKKEWRGCNKQAQKLMHKLNKLKSIVGSNYTRP